MQRVYHTWDKWECYPAGFYDEKPPKGMTADECEEAYRAMLADTALFGEVLENVITEWVNSCEHYLTNENMNRIAWLGQSALAYHLKIPSRFRGGYNLLDDEQKLAADTKALEYLNKWREQRGAEPLTLDQCQSKTQPNLY
jgi:hypothetical protein